MRGEYVAADVWCSTNKELPPRARRILRRCRSHRRFVGTTSACAENTPRVAHEWCEPGNYLRVRGEYQPNPNHYGDPLELPPRARRIRATDARYQRICGTTSACAENTATRTTPSTLGWNYLRVRGEYKSWNNGYRRNTELPPRARRIPR